MVNEYRGSRLPFAVHDFCSIFEFFEWQNRSVTLSGKLEPETVFLIDDLEYTLRSAKPQTFATWHRFYSNLKEAKKAKQRL